MTTPRSDETGPSQNSSYRDTRSRSLQRIVRLPVRLSCGVDASELHSGMPDASILTVEIKNSQPIELEDLTQGLQSLGDEYTHAHQEFNFLRAASKRRKSIAQGNARGIWRRTGQP